MQNPTPEFVEVSDLDNAFLNTTTLGDYVNVFVHDHATVELLSEKAVSVDYITSSLISLI